MRNSDSWARQATGKKEYDYDYNSPKLHTTIHFCAIVGSLCHGPAQLSGNNHGQKE